MKFIVLVAVWASHAVAMAAVQTPNTEGFSSGALGLPAALTEAWQATVLIQKTSRNCSDREDSRSWGGGVIVNFDSRSRTVVIVTNSHVINGCRGGNTSMEIGFQRNDNSDDRDFTGSFKVLSDSPGIDLAVIRAEVPKKVNPAVARLVLPVPTSTVFAIGFPDLKARKDWSVR
ncbi:MAG: trypsin-like peptidase domain-containing protein, partial [Bdellovibrionia bacterium]